MWSHIYSELTRGYILEHDEAKYTEKRERVYNVFKIPLEVEKVVLHILFYASLWFAANFVSFCQRRLHFC